MPQNQALLKKHKNKKTHSNLLDGVSMNPLFTPLVLCEVCEHLSVQDCVYLLATCSKLHELLQAQNAMWFRWFQHTCPDAVFTAGMAYMNVALRLLLRDGPLPVPSAPLNVMLFAGHARTCRCNVVCHLSCCKEEEEEQVKEQENKQQGGTHAIECGSCHVVIVDRRGYFLEVILCVEFAVSSKIISNNGDTLRFVSVDMYPVPPNAPLLLFSACQEVDYGDEPCGGPRVSEWGRLDEMATSVGLAHSEELLKVLLSSECLSHCLPQVQKALRLNLPQRRCDFERTACSPCCRHAHFLYFRDCNNIPPVACVVNRLLWMVHPEKDLVDEGYTCIQDFVQRLVSLVLETTSCIEHVNDEEILSALFIGDKSNEDFSCMLKHAASEGRRACEHRSLLEMPFLNALGAHAKFWAGVTEYLLVDALDVAGNREEEESITAVALLLALPKLK